MGTIDRATESQNVESNGLCRLGSAEVELAYQLHGDALLRFLRHVMRDEQQAADALQATFVKLIETGGSVAPEKLKSWLFRVAFNAALNMRRRLKVEHRSLESVGVWRSLSGRAPSHTSLDAETRELVERALAACELLTPDQRQVIDMRLRENLKFREIAERLRIPLGTVLTRMRTGLLTLRNELQRLSAPQTPSLNSNKGCEHESI